MPRRAVKGEVIPHVGAPIGRLVPPLRVDHVLMRHAARAQPPTQQRDIRRGVVIAPVIEPDVERLQIGCSLG